MRRYFITRGAKTTAGGTVVGGLENFRIKQVDIALEGHEVLCPACKTTGTIVCVGPRRSQYARGRKVALSDDICLCKCAPPPRLITDQFERYQTLTAEDTSVQGKAAPVSPPSQVQATTPRTTPTSASRPTTPTFSEVLEYSCERSWRFYQKQAEDVVAPGGKLIAAPRLRNRLINSAYAHLWRLDNRFQWAGLAAFASKQVGCGLPHAADSIEKIQVEYEVAQQLRRSARKGYWPTSTRSASTAPARASARIRFRMICRFQRIYGVMPDWRVGNARDSL